MHLLAELNTPPPVEPGMPPAVQASLCRHRQHLAELVGTMRSAGFDEQAIEGSLSTLIDSYRAELATALRTLRDEGRE